MGVVLLSIFVIVVGASCAVFKGAIWFYASRSSQYLLWAPLLKRPESVVVCVADVLPSQMLLQQPKWAESLADLIAGRASPAPPANQSEVPFTPFVDAEVSARISSWLRMHGKLFRVARGSSLTLDDFRRGPVVLIGAFDNSWNLSLLSKLRYHVQIDPITKAEWIEDSQNLKQHDWRGSGNLLYSDSSTDFALITRVFDQDTGNWILAAGGLGNHGTEAAGDLLTNSELSRVLPNAVRGSSQNFQIVLKTTVISGHTGNPQIVAVYSW
jgi:hypothetical protein